MYMTYAYEPYNQRCNKSILYPERVLKSAANHMPFIICTHAQNALVGNLKERDYLGDIGVDGRIFN
jgi:hypothetical protein